MKEAKLKRMSAEELIQVFGKEFAGWFLLVRLVKHVSNCHDCAELMAKVVRHVEEEV